MSPSISSGGATCQREILDVLRCFRMLENVTVSDQPVAA